MRHFSRLLWLVLAAFALLFPNLARAEQNLLAGKQPHAAQGMRSVSRLTDGKAARDGDFWKTDLTARFAEAGAFVVYDLGSERTIKGAWLQGDNNDTYELFVSKDGKTFTPLWQARPARGNGLQPRVSPELDATARYLKITARGGDGLYGLSEVQLYDSVNMAPQIPRRMGVPLDQSARNAILLFGLALAISVLVASRESKAWLLGLLVAIAVFAGYNALSAIREAWPLDNREVSLVRGVLGAVGAIAILREAFAPPRFRAHRPLTLSVLGVCAGLSFLAFYNLGRPQFWDAKNQNWTFVHYLDLRQYFPTAKYFNEIGYRGMYEADVVAYVESTPGVSLDSIPNMPIRDLSNLQMSTVSEERDQIEQVKAKFAPERWEAYKADAKYLRDAMGSGHYLETMYDMGGNATPVWMSIAYLLFNAVGPSNSAFLFTAALDPLLLLGAFAAIAYAFGLRTMLVSMIVFGANDFIMYGTNWGGATLRHDWLAYLAFGACALKREKWLLGGAFFGMAAMIRAFPVLALFGATLPMLWWAIDKWRSEGSFPALKTIALEHQPVVKTLLGGAIAVAVLFIFSIIVLPADAWSDWLLKVRQLSSDPHGNHISLRNFLCGWEENQGQVLAGRRPLFIAATLLFTFGVFLGTRGKRLEQAAMLALLLIPVWFYPANYYSHFVFLLPLVVLERRRTKQDSAAAQVPALTAIDAGVCAILLTMCAIQYFTVLIPDLPLHFYMESVVLFAMITSLLTLLGRPQLLSLGIWDPVPATGNGTQAVRSPAEAPATEAREADEIAEPKPSDPEAAAPKAEASPSPASADN